MTGNLSSDISLQPPPQRGNLYLAAPLPRAAAALRAALGSAGIPVVEVANGVCVVPFSARTVQIWAKVFSGVFNAAEMESIKCRLLPIGTEPSSADLMQAQSLAKFLDWLEGQWLAEVLRSRRLMSFFQPIVHVTNPAHVYAYECLLRGRSATGQLISPDRLYHAARGTGLLPALDRAARVTAIESAAQHRLNTLVFINFNPNAIHRTDSCFASTLAATKATGFAPERFVFEVVESEEIHDPAGLLSILASFRERGFRVALDDVGAGYASLNLLARVQPDFMKLDMGLIRNVHRDLYKSHVAAKLLELARELNVKTVVEGIESVGEWQWSREHGADYAQGYLFARPEALPPLPRSEFDSPATCEATTCAVNYSEHSRQELALAR